MIVLDCHQIGFIIAARLRNRLAAGVQSDHRRYTTTPSEGGVNMRRSTFSIGVASLLAVFAIAATPAFAEVEFRSNVASTSEGPVQLKSGTAAIFNPGETEAVVECTRLSKSFWVNQTKFYITEFTQQRMRNGPHQGLKVDMTSCSAKIAGLSLAADDVICIVQVEANTSTTGTGSIFETCNFKVPSVSCVIGVPATKLNIELGKASYANIESSKGVELDPALNGLTTTVSEGCKSAGLKGGKVGTFKASFINSGVKVV